MAVAATFLTVSATSALAQSDPARNSAAELAIDAAVPRPEPANVPPPTINDFKMDSAAPAADAVPERMRPRVQTRPRTKPPEAKPADVVTAPAADTNKADTAKKDTAVTTPAAPPPAAAAAAPAAEPVKAASNVPAADQPVADKLQGDARRQVGALFRPQGRAGRGREILHRA